VEYQGTYNKYSTYITETFRAERRLNTLLNSLIACPLLFFLNMSREGIRGLGDEGIGDQNAGVRARDEVIMA